MQTGAMGAFYKNYWFPANTKNDPKKTAFDEATEFTMEYVGSSKSSADILTSKSFSKITKEEQMIEATIKK